MRVEQAQLRPSARRRGRKAGQDFARRVRRMAILLLHGERFDQRTRTWKPLVLMTNMPLSEDGQCAGPFTFMEVAQLYKSRRDIETFFRFARQHVSFEHLVSRSENGVRIMLYVSLIAAMLLIWYQRLTGIDRGWRSVKFWFAHDVATWTRQALHTVGFSTG